MRDWFCGSSACKALVLVAVGATACAEPPPAGGLNAHAELIALSFP